MYKVFINNKLLLVTANVPNGATKGKADGRLFNGENEIGTAIGYCMENGPGNAFLVSANPENLWKSFQDRFTIIEAAGGLVQNADGKMLMIFRKGKWDLPKGKLDAGETPEAAAVREVGEETGVCNLEIASAPTVTFHTYRQDKKNVLKKTYWYKMNCTHFDRFALQKEENIEQAGWYTKEEVKKRLEQSYPLIRELVYSLQFTVRGS